MKAIAIAAVAAGLLALGLSLDTPASARGIGPCYYKCIGGQPHYCCVGPAGETCKPASDDVFNCPH